MNLTMLQRPMPLTGLGAFLKRLMPQRRRDAPADPAPEDRQAHRDVVMEMLDRHPDAFRSEMDVQTLAHLYRCRF